MPIEMTYEQRAQGVLPHIDIAGTDFTVDWRLRELRETAAPWNRIELQRAEMSPEGEAYYLLYDQDSHEEFVFDDEVAEVPEGVVFIKVPYEVRLDPYAVAIQYGIDPKEFVEKFPFEKNLRADVRPLSETNIAAMAAENRQRIPEEAARPKR